MCPCLCDKMKLDIQLLLLSISVAALVTLAGMNTYVPTYRCGQAVNKLEDASAYQKTPPIAAKIKSDTALQALKATADTACKGMPDTRQFYHATGLLHIANGILIGTAICDLLIFGAYIFATIVSK